ncbi:MAG: glutamine synthetase type III, partial [Clostridia bacterium]|nr:glutamine synthetase type III [Clostridia bacterium]
NEIYCKTLNIEALTMVKMARQDILPAVLTYLKDVSETLAVKKAAMPTLSSRVEEELITKLSAGADKLYEAIEALDEDIARTANFTEASMKAFYFKETVIPAMDAVRAVADEMEELTAKKYWPYPSCGDLLFSIV